MTFPSMVGAMIWPDGLTNSEKVDCKFSKNTTSSIDSYSTPSPQGEHLIKVAQGLASYYRMGNNYII